MKKYLSLVILILLFVSCIGISDRSDQQIQFNSDDLSFLYYDSDTLLFDGNTIEFKDTISFLLNRTEVKKVQVVTKINSNRSSPFDLYGESTIEGESYMKFNEETGFSHALVGVSRDFINDSGSKKYIYVSVEKRIAYNKFFYPNDKIIFDTALILGVCYDNVIKFKPDSLSNRNTNIKSIYFAKKFGFIKIETIDGKTMERIFPDN